MKPTIFDPIDVIRNILELAVKDIDDSAISKNKKIHSIRVVSKKIRSIFQLIKHFLKDKELLEDKKNFYKNLSKNLSKDREKKVMYDTLHLVVKKYKLRTDDFEDVENMLKLNNENNITDTGDIDKNIELSKKYILSELNSMDKWKRKTYKKSNIKKGFQRTYKKAYDILQIAIRTKKIEDIHRFRKYAKYHMYQIGLLSNHIKYPAKKGKYLARLTSSLGKSHDLSLFKDYIVNNKNLINYALLIDCINDMQKKHIKKSLKLANKIFKKRDLDFKLLDK